MLLRLNSLMIRLKKRNNYIDNLSTFQKLLYPIVPSRIDVINDQSRIRHETFTDFLQIREKKISEETFRVE